MFLNSFLSGFFYPLICYAHNEKVHPLRNALFRYGVAFDNNVPNLVTLRKAEPPKKEAPAAEPTKKETPQQQKVFTDEPIRERRTVFEGEIHKCPNCGEVLQSFVINCPTCGHEFRGAKNSTSVREFAAKLEEIERSRPVKKFGLKKALANQTEVSETDLRKISLIRSFVIPNTKEDLLEFLVLASSNINLQRYNDFDSISESEQAVSDAWEAKFEQAYEKAKLSFGNTPEFKKIQAIYEKKSGEIKQSKKKRTYYWIGFAALFICIGVFSFGGLFMMGNADDKKIEAENARMEAIVEEVYDALEDENYVLARAKAASLTFSGPNTTTADKASEKWDKTRTELLAIIDAAAGGDSNKIPETNEPSNSDKPSDENSLSNKVEVPNDFITGYEKAEFDKYNSPASENGLGDSRIYFYCTLDKTEILEADGTTSILGYVTDDGGNEWLIQLHFVPAVSKTAFDSYVGKDLVLRGVYSGFSGTKEMPVVVLDEMFVLDTGENVMGMQKLLDE